MHDGIPRTRTVVIILAITAVLVVWQGVGWLWGAGKFEEDVRQARLGYAHVAPRAYRVEFTLDNCMCFRKHVRVTVDDGEIVQVENLKLPTFHDPFPDEVLSKSPRFAKQDRWIAKYVVFPDAFDAIAANSDADVVRASFDATNGTPNWLYIDWRRGTFDDEVTFAWHDFEVLDR